MKTLKEIKYNLIEFFPLIIRKNYLKTLYIFFIIFLLGKYYYNKSINTLVQNKKVYNMKLETYYELLANNYSLKDKSRIISIAKNKLNLEEKNNYSIVIEENKIYKINFIGTQ